MKKSRVRYDLVDREALIYESGPLFAYNKVVFVRIDIPNKMWSILDRNTNKVLHSDVGKHYIDMTKKAKKYLREIGTFFYDEIRKKDIQ